MEELKNFVRDDWFETFGRGKENENLFFETQKKMEVEHSKWYENVERTFSEILTLTPIEALSADWLSGMDPDAVADTIAQNKNEEARKTSLFLSFIDSASGERVYLPLSDNGCYSAYSVVAGAGKPGIAWRSFEPSEKADHLNKSISKMRGQYKSLARFGKVRNNASSNYKVMEISQLLEDAKNGATKFGEVELLEGYISIDMTTAVWTLPGSQQVLCQRYREVIDENSGSKMNDMFMPGLYFSSSDTSNRAATLEPVFITDSGCLLHFVDGVRIRHDTTEENPMARFKDEANNMFAKFENIFEKLAELSKVKIYHAENAVINICNAYSISGKYGESAREEVVRLAYGEPYITAHDLYVCMIKIIEAAKESGASGKTVMNLDEQLSKIPSIKDWSVFDVGGGTPAWGAKTNN